MDTLFVFDSWTSINAATGLSKVVTTNLYEDVADSDYEVRREGGREGGWVCLTPGPAPMLLRASLKW